MSEALYFPFSRCLDELTLKRAALVYDRLLFVDPVTPEARNALYLREQHADPTITHRWRRAQQHYERLEYEGIASTVTANVISDPEGMDALVADGLHVDIEINKTPGTLFNGRHRWKMLASRVPESMYYGRHRPKPAQAFAGEEIVEVSYAAGSSLSLTHAIAIAHELGATPLTDSRAHHDLLLYRMKTAAAAGADHQLPGMHAPPPGPPDAYLRRQIELRVIDALIPDERLHGMDFGELIDYRHRHASARQDLSGWVDKLATEAHQKPWDSSLETELGRIAAEARNIAGQPGRWRSAADAAGGSMGVGQLAVQGALTATPLLGGMVLGWPLLAALAASDRHGSGHSAACVDLGDQRDGQTPHTRTQCGHLSDQRWPPLTYGATGNRGADRNPATRDPVGRSGHDRSSSSQATRRTRAQRNDALSHAGREPAALTGSAQGGSVRARRLRAARRPRQVSR